MEQFGLTIVSYLIKGVAGGMMPSLLPKVAEVLLQFAQTYPDQFRIWMERLLIDPADNLFRGSVTENDRRDFLKALLCTRQLKRYREAIKAFSVKCRGLEGTAFGSI